MTVSALAKGLLERGASSLGHSQLLYYFSSVDIGEKENFIWTSRFFSHF